MNNAVVEPKERKHKPYLGFALVAVLVIVVIAFLAFQNGMASQDPLLFNNSVTVQISTDKPFYSKGEEISITVSVINGKNDPVNCTTSIRLEVFDSNGQKLVAVLL